MGKKSLAKKLRLGAIVKQNRRVPAWIVMKTGRRFNNHPKRHHWRRSWLKQ